jgi:hypothetical protein
VEESSKEAREEASEVAAKVGTKAMSFLVSKSKASSSRDVSKSKEAQLVSNYRQDQGSAHRIRLKVGLVNASKG